MPSTISSSHLARLDKSVIPESLDNISIPDIDARIEAAQAAESVQEEAIAQASSVVLKAFGYNTIEDSEAKCLRDMSIVYRYCVFAMLSNDFDFLEEKLLAWLSPLLHSRGFPGKGDSIRAAYTVLSQEALTRLPGEARDLMEPYWSVVLRHLGQEEAVE